MMIFSRQLFGMGWAVFIGKILGLVGLMPLVFFSIWPSCDGTYRLWRLMVTLFAMSG